MRQDEQEQGILQAEDQKENGPFPRQNRQVLVFSIGAGNESHGSALPSNIDDYTAIKTATTVSMRLGLVYLGHIPYSSDRAGPIAKDWNPGYLPPNELIRRMIEDLKTSVRIQAEVLGNRTTRVVVVGGHGGNNFLESEEVRISEELGTPFHYIPPFQGVSSVRSERYGKMIELTHADDGEHSVGLYLGLLDQKKLRRINEIAKRDPKEALRQNPAIMGLGYYVLPELSGERYEALRSRHKELLNRAIRFVETDRRIIADYDAGKRLVDKNIENTTKRIKGLLDD